MLCDKRIQYRLDAGDFSTLRKKENGYGLRQNIGCFLCGTFCRCVGHFTQLRLFGLFGFRSAVPLCILPIFFAPVFIRQRTLKSNIWYSDIVKYQIVLFDALLDICMPYIYFDSLWMFAICTRFASVSADVLFHSASPYVCCPFFINACI